MNQPVRILLATIVIFMGAFAAWALADRLLSANQSGDGEFKTLIERYYTQWSTLNPDNAAPLYAKDADLVFFDLAPLKYIGWAEYKEGVQKNFFEKMSGGRVTPGNDLKVVRRGNIAWTMVTNHFSIRLKDGRTIETDGRHTAIWEKRAASG